MRLHLGCGPVFLRDYINIDVKGELAKDRPDLVEKNSTTVRNYFKTPYVKQPLGHNKRKEIVVDLKCNVQKLPYTNNTVDEILSVNLIEHLKYGDFIKALREWHRVLRPNGLLIIDVENIKTVVKMFEEVKNREEIEWILRMVYCHARDKYDVHHWGYYPEYLESILEENGFGKFKVRKNYIKHVYPVFQLFARKI